MKGLFIPDITAETLRSVSLEVIETLIAEGEFYDIDYDPERKTGRWVKKVDDGVYWYECSECGDYPLKSAFGHDCYSEWCPHCGAKLEGVEECQR